MQIYEKSSNNERKREKRFIFCGFQGFGNGIWPTRVIIVRTGRTASTLFTYCECTNDVLKLSPYSFGGLPEYLYFCNQLRNSYDITRDIQSESQGRLHRLLCRAESFERAVSALFGGAADA